MTVDLVAFLREQLDAEEQEAQAATPGPWRYNPDKMWNLPGPSFGEEFVGAGPLGKTVCVAGTGPADEPQSMADAEFIARHDPARILAEITAKRAIVDRMAGMLATADGDSEVDHYGGLDAAERVLTLLAAPYAGVDGYRPEWAPEAE